MERISNNCWLFVKNQKNTEKYKKVKSREIYSKIGPIVRNNSEQMPLCLPIRNTGDEGGEFVFILK